MAYHVESGGGIHLDTAVEIAKKNGHREEEKIDGIPNVMAEQFDKLAHQHPGKQRAHGQQVGVGGPGNGGFVAEKDEEQVAEQGGRRQGGQMNGIGTPGLAEPNVLFVEHAGQIAAPVAAGPAGTLLEELDVVFEGGLDFGFRVVLDVGLPAMRDHPARDKVVVVGIEVVLAKPPFLVGEAVGEDGILQDLSAIGHGPARETGQATIDVGGGGTVKVAAFEIQGGQKAPDALGPGWGGMSTETLAGADTAEALVDIKGSQDPGQDGWGPAHIVVGEDSDGGAYVRNGPDHLMALVWVGDGEKTDA